MSQALYRKYRSRSLDEVLGQDHITSILRSAIKQNKIAHAYLLTGPRGTGKTSVARILAHEINQLPYTGDETHLDIIEIDAASNNGVDNIRDLREKSRIAPVEAKKKIYIIDEVHMLSGSAFNALLKTLEEPPAHVMFIMATTDADKLPATIISRVQQFHFHPISEEVIANHLEDIAKKEGFAIEPEAARLIASHSRGGFRDAISLLDQLSVLATDKEPLTAPQVTSQLGLNDQETIVDLINSWRNQDSTKSLQILSQLEASGARPKALTNQLIDQLRKDLTNNSNDILLIRELIEVSTHPHPDLKLLTIFASSSGEPSKKYIPKAEPVPLQISEPKPSYAAASVVKTKSKIEASPKQPKSLDTAKIDSLDWDALLANAKETSPGLLGLLAKCTHDIDDGAVQIYAGTAFVKKKLEDSKFMPLLSQILEKTTGKSVNIKIIDKKQPPKDEKLAAIAAMMGGGEEVNLGDIS